jgi:Zn ribbon nucleic-acid-binding protein
MTTPAEAATPAAAHVRPAPAPARGLVCPGCSSARLDVTRTQRHPGRIVRVRRCLDCGHQMRTAERVESARA